MPTLSTELRNRLKDAVIAARDIAEAGSRGALESLAVHHHEPYGHMTIEERSLRKKLRVHAMQLGDKCNQVSGIMGIDQLVTECAYEHWHRMLFARFLAENHLLIEPDSGMAISLEECEELAREEGLDTWALAGRYAQSMLPQIFRPNDPLLHVKLARNHQLPLEDCLKGLVPETFTASDSLGWVYQFWQAKKKDEVNASGEKIGARELPAVTQLFTEPYMVSFLIHNTLGAWLFERMKAEGGHINGRDEDELRRALALPGLSLEYLRFVKDEDGELTPAAGKFERWPDAARDLTILDPCCGSGHFLVALFNHLVPLRMAREGLSPQEACNAVLADNLHGLELDERCTQIAAFALALAAWQYPGSGGYRTLPQLPVACSGLSVGAAREEWKQLGLNKKNLGLALGWMHDFFAQAPTLGSLLDPRESDGAKLIEWEELSQTLDEALSREQGEEAHEARVAAQGLARAARMSAGRYYWVITNVPYLARGKQGDILKNFCARNYKEAKNDLATVFLERCLGLCKDGGIAGIVLPQNWLFLTTYKKFRKKLLCRHTWRMIARLGPGAFETITGEVVKAILLIMSRGLRHDDGGLIRVIDASELPTTQEKAALLFAGEVKEVAQDKQLDNPGVKISLNEIEIISVLSDYAFVHYGSKPGQTARVTRQFWEIYEIENGFWIFMGSSPSGDGYISGKSEICYSLDSINQFGIEAFGVRGSEAWGSKGIIVSKMSSLPHSAYLGEFYDDNTCVIIPQNTLDCAAILTSMENGEFSKSVRSINQKVSVTKESLEGTPLDLEHWTKVAKERYPHGLPEPFSDDPTQWFFHGHPCGSVIWSEATKRLTHGPQRTNETVLQVGVTRLLGYRWPAELDPEMELAPEQREWVNRCEELWPLTDEDGIVLIPSLRGEDAADDRLRKMLSTAYGHSWSPAQEQQLLFESGNKSADFDDWLRNQFFEYHCKLFQHRPFIWHIWDGRKRDGFHVLVNYHKLAEGNGKGRQLLEKLTYGYLGDWITLQKDGVKQGTGGAEDRLAAAQQLEKRLKAILEGEPPYDIFVRWKPLSQQPIGWEPDVNDGVRLNIRPFLVDDIPGGKKGAGILRAKPNIKWTKDRGKDVSSAPWYNLGLQYGGNKGDRINDHHLTIAERQEARERMKE